MTREISGYTYSAPKHLPARYRGVRFADIERHEGNEHALTQLEDILHERPGHSVSGLTLVGSNGTGKTMAACALLNEIVVPGFRGAYVASESYVRARLEHMTLSRQMGSSTGMDEWAQERAADRYTYLTKLLNAYLPERPYAGVRYDVLVLDDLGREHHTDTGYAEDELDYLVRSRFDQGLMTICTSNREPSEWNPERPAFGHLVKEACPPVLMLGTDYRDRFARQ